jgi:hypothetical protein
VYYSDDFIFDSIEPPVAISTLWIRNVSSPVTKTATSTVSIEIHSTGLVKICFLSNEESN